MVPGMFARGSYTKGFTLIELVISIVVVGAGVTAIFSLTTQAASYGTDPMTYKQSMAIAESYMEEIRGKRFSTGSCPSVPTSNVRANYSYICHYDTSGSDVAIADQQGNSILDWSQYTVRVTVTNSSFNGITSSNAQKIVVLVQHASTNTSVSLTSYRTNY